MFKLCLVLLVIAIHCNKIDTKVPDEYDYFTELFDENRSTIEPTPTEKEEKKGKSQIKFYSKT